jgi:hypothetical protein
VERVREKGHSYDDFGGTETTNLWTLDRFLVVISGFRRVVNGIFALLGSCAT